jgi:hypothetical protein
MWGGCATVEGSSAAAVPHNNASAAPPMANIKTHRSLRVQTRINADMFIASLIYSAHAYAC